MDGKPAKSKNDNDHQNHFNNPFLVSNALCGGMTTWGLGPQSAQHNRVHAADQEQWKDITRNKEGNLQCKKKFLIQKLEYLNVSAELYFPYETVF